MRLLLVVILFLAAILRLWNLSSYPAGFTPDEASFGYDAYSIINSGRDQWGESFPLAFRSFGDFKAPLYTYLTIPSIAIFGLNEFAVRLPNAILGVLGVLVVYLLSLELVKTQKDDKLYTIRYLPYIAALLFAVSPWNISLSRGAFEANLTTLLMPLGVLAFLKGVKDSRWMLVAAIAFGFNLFSYHSAKLITPLIILILLWSRRKEGTRVLRSAVVRVFGLVLLLFLGLSIFSFFSGSGSRAGDIGIFNPTGGWEAVADRRYEAVKSGLPDITARLFSNKIVYTGSEFVKNYLSYLSPTFLFTQGAGEATYGMIPGHGVLYLFELPFIVIGLWNLARGGWKWNSPMTFIAIWILLSPIPAALTKGPGFAANRVAVMMPGIQILSAYGAIILWQKLKDSKTEKLKNVVLWAYGAIAVLGILFFLEAYFYHAPRINAPSMSYGWRDVIMEIGVIGDNYQEIVISRAFSEPHIFVAFYNQWDPSHYQKQAQDWRRYDAQGLLFVDQLGEWKLGKYTFRDIRYSEDSKLEKTLLVGRARDFPSDTKSEFEVKDFKGNIIFKAVSVENE